MPLDSTIRFLLSFLFLTQYLNSSVLGEPQVPCYFIFGDSLADPGNNNGLVTQAKSDYPPYGVDFPGGSPTGRFTNNRTVVDVIGELLGFDELIPPFATSATGEDILKGVNYASAASGIRDETGMQQGDIISMNEQLRNHFTTVSRITGFLKNEDAAKKHLGKCMYAVITGNNDYINNYFMPDFYTTSSQYTPQQYADVLVDQYSQQLKLLYSYGARKVAVFGVGPIGQTPEMRRRFGAISTAVTATAQLFSNKLPSLVNNLNQELSGAKFTYINSGVIAATGVPASALLNILGSCCQTVQGLGTCVSGSSPCRDRRQYAFFDGFHPTDVVTVALARRAYNKLLPSDASPYDISELIEVP